MPNPDVFPRNADRYPEINVITDRNVRPRWNRR